MWRPLFSLSLLRTFIFFTFYNCIVQMGLLPSEIRVAFPGESQLRQSRATQPPVHAGCSSVSIIHRTRTWTMRSLTCAQMLLNVIAHGKCSDTVRESALKADSARKNSCRTGESSLRRQRAGPMLYQLSYIPNPSPGLDVIRPIPPGLSWKEDTTHCNANW